MIEYEAELSANASYACMVYCLIYAKDVVCIKFYN